MTSDIAVSVVAVVVVIALLLALALLLAFLAYVRHDVDGPYGQQISIAQPEEEMLATAEMVNTVTDRKIADQMQVFQNVSSAGDRYYSGSCDFRRAVDSKRAST